MDGNIVLSWTCNLIFTNNRMTDFRPPISERETEELIGIANSSTKYWQQEAINQAKKELMKRNISVFDQNEVVEKWNDEAKGLMHEEFQRLENNKTESYTKFEMIVLFVFGPLLFMKPFFFSKHTLFTLRNENYYLKFKQRIIIFILSFATWFTYLNYQYEQSEKKRLEEIEKIDISDWKQKHGYK